MVLLVLDLVSKHEAVFLIETTQHLRQGRLSNVINVNTIQSGWIFSFNGNTKQISKQQNMIYRHLWLCMTSRTAASKGEIVSLTLSEAMCQQFSPTLSSAMLQFYTKKSWRTAWRNFLWLLDGLPPALQPPKYLSKTHASTKAQPSFGLWTSLVLVSYPALSHSWQTKFPPRYLLAASVFLEFYWQVNAKANIYSVALFVICAQRLLECLYNLFSANHHNDELRRAISLHITLPLLFSTEKELRCQKNAFDPIMLFHYSS